MKKKHVHEPMPDVSGLTQSRNLTIGGRGLDPFGLSVGAMSPVRRDSRGRAYIMDPDGTGAFRRWDNLTSEHQMAAAKTHPDIGRLLIEESAATAGDED